MAAAKKQSKNEEYLFCKICKRNHTDGRKHIYSKKHKQKLITMLKRFGSKIAEAKSFLRKASVIDGEMEPGSRIWCYCCEIEINKHTTDGNTTIQQGGVLEHIASSDHHKNTRKFWWENGAEKSQLSSFILFEAELDSFKKSVSKEMDKLDAQRESRTKQIAEQIKETEIRQAQLVTGTRKELPHALLSPPQPLFPTTSTPYYNSRRNVHTGATPPWLLDIEDCNGGSSSGYHGNGAMIGPSEDEFLKWQEKRGKGKKNPKRVGANFHQNLKRLGLLDNDADDWLPNFGRVWNAGPRSHTMKEFRNELSATSVTTSSVIDSTSKTITSTPSVSFYPSSTSMDPLNTTSNPSDPSSFDLVPSDVTINPPIINCSDPSTPFSLDLPSDVTVQPYVRKRPMKRSHPDDIN